MFRWKEKGQTMAEFALVMPILILLMFGMTFAAFYAFRSAAADWGVFITGVASGSYNTPATEHARDNVLWPDLADRINAGQTGPRQVRSLISVEKFTGLDIWYSTDRSATSGDQFPPMALLSRSASGRRV